MLDAFDAFDTSSTSHQLLRDIVRFFEHINEKNLVFTDWKLNQKFFNIAIWTITRKVIDFAKWLKKRKKIYKQFRSLSVNVITETLRTSQSTQSITSEISFRNKESFKELIRVSFKLSKNLSFKTHQSEIFLRKNKEKHSTERLEIISESFAKSTRNIAVSSSFVKVSKFSKKSLQQL
jgi:hypothetical protein